MWEIDVVESALWAPLPHSVINAEIGLWLYRNDNLVYCVLVKLLQLE